VILQSLPAVWERSLRLDFRLQVAPAGGSERTAARRYPNLAGCPPFLKLAAHSKSGRPSFGLAPIIHRKDRRVREEKAEYGFKVIAVSGHAGAYLRSRRIENCYSVLLCVLRDLCGE
jgi:hypothetical protein